MNIKGCRQALQRSVRTKSKVVDSRPIGKSIAMVGRLIKNPRPPVSIQPMQVAILEAASGHQTQMGLTLLPYLIRVALMKIKIQKNMGTRARKSRHLMIVNL